MALTSMHVEGTAPELALGTVRGATRPRVGSFDLQLNAVNKVFVDDSLRGQNPNEMGRVVLRVRSKADGVAVEVVDAQTGNEDGSLHAVPDIWRSEVHVDAVDVLQAGGIDEARSLLVW